MNENPYEPTRDPDASTQPWPRLVYITAHVAILIALVILLWPVLGIIGGFRIDGQHPVPDGTILSTIQAAGVGYWWLIWTLTLLTDIALLVVLRCLKNPPVRKAWFCCSTMLIAVNSLIVYALYMFVFRHDIPS